MFYGGDLPFRQLGVELCGLRNIIYKYALFGYLPVFVNYPYQNLIYILYKLNYIQTFKLAFR